MSMIPPMQRSAGDTFFRAIVMGAVLGFVVWAAVRYTTIPQQMLHEVIKWSEKASAHLAGSQQRDDAWQTDAALWTNGYAADHSGFRTILTDNSSPPMGANRASPIPTEVDGRIQGQQSHYLAAEVPATEALEVIDQRLRELGAVYSLLETWGRQSPRYRYQCRIALEGNEQHTHSFEAPGRSPREAMLLVLRDVENYHAQAGMAERHPW